jgi:sec-independent protein translocase protein TatA
VGVTVGSIGVPELLIALLLLLLLFGGSQLPKLARSFGQAKSELKKAADEKPADPESDSTAS